MLAPHDYLPTDRGAYRPYHRPTYLPTQLKENISCLLSKSSPGPKSRPGRTRPSCPNVETDTIVPRTGRNAGQHVPVLRWNFEVDGVEERIESITGRDPTSEKSNLFKYFVATLGSDKAKWLDAETEDLVGKPVLVTIGIKEDGWPEVTNVTARPVRRQNPIPASNPAAEAAVPQPIQHGFADKLPEAEPVIATAVTPRPSRSSARCARRTTNCPSSLWGWQAPSPALTTSARVTVLAPHERRSPGPDWQVRGFLLRRQHITCAHTTTSCPVR